LCWAIDGRSALLVSRDPLAGSWAVLRGITPLGGLEGVACASDELCFGVDDLGDLYYGAPGPGARWVSEPLIDLLTPFTAIACPSASLCVAGDGAGDLFVSSTPRNPFTWSLPIPVDAGHRITGLSCPSRSLCVAVDDAGDLLSSTTPTSPPSWVQTRLISTSALDGVSCTAAALCVVVAGDGHIFASGNLAAAPPTWSTTPADGSGGLTGISCTNTALCVAVDRDGTAYESDTPTADTPDWEPASLRLAPGGVTSVSCVAAGFCLSAEDGTLMLGRLPAPSPTTDFAAATSQTSAVLNADVDANGAVITRCTFEYGPSSAYGDDAPCSPWPRPIAGPQPLVARLHGLRPDETYHFRIVAASALGAAVGGDALVTTPPLLRASPSLVGITAVGSVLACHANLEVPSTDTVTYAWLRDAEPIAGAAGPTYEITDADGTHHLGCRVTVSGDGGTTTAGTGYVSIPDQAGATITETRVGPIRIAAARVGTAIACSPEAAPGCAISLTLTATAIVDHRRTTVMVGTATGAIAAGTTRRLHVSLDRRGQRLLRHRRRLRDGLTVSGTIVGELVARLEKTTLVLSAPTARHGPQR
jgi:hypothetical protein